MPQDESLKQCIDRLSALPPRERLEAFREIQDPALRRQGGVAAGESSRGDAGRVGGREHEPEPPEARAPPSPGSVNQQQDSKPAKREIDKIAARMYENQTGSGEPLQNEALSAEKARAEFLEPMPR